ncbi:hypothetical protein ACFFNY_24900 [Paenibacillus hodogayensis]|uniref:Uncharacterized protein n=1 Tax=Paenibacillus hodogayensis TaxID=279208 RepID=A0ABV5W2N7_9BACL
MKSTVLRIAFGILLLPTVISCSSEQTIDRPIGLTPTAGHASPQQVQAVYRPDLFPEQVKLPFSESVGEPLEEGGPSASAHLVRSFALPDSQAEVRIYSDAGAASSLTAYLKGAKSEWKLGPLPAGGENPDQTWFNPLPFISGEASGVSIEVPFGSIGSQNGLLVYNKQTDSWQVADFQGHRAVPLDLDGDGVPEWVGNQTDWVPPAVEIHRWVPERERFESTVVQMDASLFPDADNHTPSYSSLFAEEGTYFMEIGNDAFYAFFTYDQGVLKQYRPADTRDRVDEMQRARGKH